MGSGCYVVVCCSINMFIVHVFIVVDTVTESDVSIVSGRLLHVEVSFNKNQLSLSSVQ